MAATRVLPTDRIVVCDGAMGTMIHSKGIPVGASFDEVNLSQPGIVQEIHRAYVEAGADILETNTFGASRIKLESHGLAHKVRDINIAGARLTKSCAGDGALVAGAVGPTSRLMHPLGPLTFDEACDVYREQIMALCEGGVDLLIIETIQDLREAKAAMLAAKAITEIPIISQMSFGQEGRTMMGTSPDVAAVVLSHFGARLVGTNCGTGPQDMLDAVRAMAAVTSCGLSAQPNAGLPRFVEGRLMYLSTPEYMSDFARQFAEAGATLVGGCCGTTPDHTRAIVDAVSGMTPMKRTANDRLLVASRTRLFEIGQLTIIGNRMAASPKLAADVKGGHFKLVQDSSESQFEAGASLIGIDCDHVPSGMIGHMVELVQTGSSAAIFLTGSDIGVLEEALRSVEGRALVTLRDSVTAVIESLLPLAKRYGSAVAFEAKEGSLEERLRTAHEVIQAAEQCGLGKESMLADPGSPEAAKLIKADLGVKCMGVDAIIADPKAIEK
jgi:5-methyltetrahydrofolate--homocysteine methyltransferase